MKQRIRLTEEDLHKIVKESVKRIISEGMINPDKWKYQGSEEDKFMWALKKDAEAKGQVRMDGWPSIEYIKKFVEYADGLFGAGFENSYIFNNDYSLEDLYGLVDDFIYRRKLEFNGDVLGRPSQNKYRTWFK